MLLLCSHSFMDQKKFDIFILSSLTHYDVWNAVPLEGKISYADLSEKVGLPVNRLHRILRHAMTRRIFYEASPGHVAHTANSAAVVKDPPLASWIRHDVDEATRGLSWLNEALDKWGDTQDPNEAALCLAFNLPRGTGFWEFLQNDGEGDRKGFRAKRFGEAMAAMSKTGVFSNAHLHNKFDWDALGKATVVDVSPFVLQCKT
jgi:6-hydroxytryprostatin B O-methyltransferase